MLVLAIGDDGTRVDLRGSELGGDLRTGAATHESAVGLYRCICGDCRNRREPGGAGIDLPIDVVVRGRGGIDLQRAYGGVDVVLEGPQVLDEVTLAGVCSHEEPARTDRLRIVGRRDRFD